jgi:DNA polymerase I-like protein with 3'-5' exonuclease and polymerase domains
MRVIDTIESDLSVLNEDENYWVYNGLDNCLTHEIDSVLQGQLDDVSRNIYNLSLALQAPVLEMNLRGLLVNQRRKYAIVKEFEAQVARIEEQFYRIVHEGVGMTHFDNWRSPTQTKELFYDVLDLPVQKKRNANGIFMPTTDEQALERLSMYFLGEPLANHLLALRGLGKMLGFLRTKIDNDGRMRTQFNIAGTNTGRFASSETDFGTGTNLQNVTSSLRSVFIADPGRILCNIDLEQADSRNMGALAWEKLYDADASRITDLLARRAKNIPHWNPSLPWRGPVGPEFAGAYLDACESGDLHTTVTKMAQPDLPWGRGQTDREVADKLAFKNKSHRDLSKGIGHGSNYMGTPPTIAKQSRLPTALVKEFQVKYFNAFPCIPAVQQIIIDELKQSSCLTTPLGRRRFFFDRPEAGATQREGVAYMGQSMTADELNYGLLRLWRTGLVELLVQVHDSILFQFDERRINEILPVALEALSTKMTLRGGRIFTVGTEAMLGWNWGYYSEDNPDGLRKWKGVETRKRQEKSFKLSVQDL